MLILITTVTLGLSVLGYGVKKIRDMLHTAFEKAKLAEQRCQALNEELTYLYQQLDKQEQKARAAADAIMWHEKKAKELERAVRDESEKSHQLEEVVQKQEARAKAAEALSTHLKLSIEAARAEVDAQKQRAEAALASIRLIELKVAEMETSSQDDKQCADMLEATIIELDKKIALLEEEMKKENEMKEIVTTRLMELEQKMLELDSCHHADSRQESVDMVSCLTNQPAGWYASLFSSSRASIVSKTASEALAVGGLRQ